MNNYIVMFFLLLNSGFPLFYNNDNVFITSHLSFLIFTIILSYNRKIKVKRLDISNLVMYSLILTILFIVQYVYFAVFNLHKLTLVLIQIITAFLVLKLLSKDFWKIYVKLISILCVISLLFYFLSFIPVIEKLMLDNALVHPYATLSGKPLRNLVLYNFNFGGVEDIYKRNSGPFWEPGAFAGYILIALYANYFILLDNGKRSLLLIFTLITTFSTMGLFSFIFLLWAKFGRRISMKRIFVFAGIGCLLLLVPREITFDKISKKSELNIGKYETKSRFSSAYLDILDLIDYPLIGRGFVNESRFDNEFINNNRNCGITDQLVRMGLPLGFLFFYLFFISFKKDSIGPNNLTQGLIGLILLLLIGFSELYFRYLFFWAINLKGIINVRNSRYS